MVKVYIEDIEVAELIYFKLYLTKKDITVPVSKTNDVTTKAELAAIRRNCVSKWQCNVWSSCIEGRQIRSCTDLNECIIETEKPAEERKCETSAVTEEPTRLTTLNLLLVLLFLIVLIVFFALSIVKIGNFELKRRKKKKVEKKKKRKKGKK